MAWIRACFVPPRERDGSLSEPCLFPESQPTHSMRVHLLHLYSLTSLCHPTATVHISIFISAMPFTIMIFPDRVRCQLSSLTIPKHTCLRVLSSSYAALFVLLFIASFVLAHALLLILHTYFFFLRGRPRVDLALFRSHLSSWFLFCVGAGP